MDNDENIKISTKEDDNGHIKLDPKHERFVQEYLVDLNAGKAAKRAGYATEDSNDANLRQIGHRIVTRVDVNKAINQRVASDGAYKHRIVQELSTIAFADITDFAYWSMNGFFIKSPDDIAQHLKCAIKKIIAIMGKEGSPTSWQIELHDKQKALDSLAKIQGSFIDKQAIVDKEGNDIPQTIINVTLKKD